LLPDASKTISSSTPSNLSKNFLIHYLATSKLPLSPLPLPFPPNLPPNPVIPISLLKNFPIFLRLSVTTAGPADSIPGVPTRLGATLAFAVDSDVGVAAPNKSLGAFRIPDAKPVASAGRFGVDAETAALKG